MLTITETNEELQIQFGGHIVNENGIEGYFLVGIGNWQTF